MHEHLKQEAEMAAMLAGHGQGNGSIPGGESDSVPVDGDITDMLG